MKESQAKTVLTFSVSDVEVDTKPLATYSAKDLVSQLFSGAIESSSVADEKYTQMHELEVNNNHFMVMLETAFCLHKPIVISPDNIWLLLSQGIAQHIKLNSKKLQHMLCKHEGKQKITVDRHDFLKGKDNPWEEIFPEFSDKLSKYLKADLYSLLVHDFSTTTLKERTAFEISFLDALSDYFEYELRSHCGIPSISLEGTSNDYRVMIDSLREVDKLVPGIELWISEVIKILEELIKTLSGSIDLDFWKSLFKYQSESGGPYISGWCTTFFPYLQRTKGFFGIKQILGLFPEKDAVKTVKVERYSRSGYQKTLVVRNPSLGNNEDHQLTCGVFPRGLSDASFIWDYRKDKIKMKFISGFIGITEDPETNQLRSEINWAIKYD